MVMAVVVVAENKVVVEVVVEVLAKQGVDRGVDGDGVDVWGGRRFGCGFGRGGFNGQVNFEECSQLLTTPDGPLERRRIARKR